VVNGDVIGVLVYTLLIPTLIQAFHLKMVNLIKLFLLLFGLELLTFPSLNIFL